MYQRYDNTKAKVFQVSSLVKRPFMVESRGSGISYHETLIDAIIAADEIAFWQVS